MLLPVQWGSRWYRQVPKSFTLSFEWVVVFECLSRDKFMNVLPWVWYLYISLFMLFALNTIIESLPMPTVPFHFENFREVHHSRITPGSVCKYYSDVERWEVQTVLGSCNDYRSAWDKRPLKMLFSTKNTFFSGRGVSEKVLAVSFCLGSGLFGRCNSN